MAVFQFSFRVDSIPRFKTSLQFVLLPFPSSTSQFYTTLDVLKASDYCLLLLSASTEVPPSSENLLRTLQSQGLPSTLCAVVPGSGEPVKQQEQPGILKSLLSFVKYFVPSQSRIFNFMPSALSNSEALNLLRAMCEGLPAEVKWRKGRGWILAEHTEFQEGSSGKGTLRVTGVIRGSSMTADRLVHIPGCGDFQISQVCLDS